VRARLATGNRHKLREFRRALPDWELELVDTSAFPPETGTTYVANARGKAKHGRAFSPVDAWVIGEDSGIEASALGGRPGLESARWANDGVERLVAELSGATDRSARYVCTIVAIGPNEREIVVEGSLEGVVGTARSGIEGFGYDPVFVPTGERRTVAELGDEWKAIHSHRALAARALAAALRPRP
jgi:XTP/dITP diphosphohydrolase